MYSIATVFRENVSVYRPITPMSPPDGIFTPESKPEIFSSSVCRSGSSTLSISTNHNINIKAEPISPPRDHLSQSGYMTHPHVHPHLHSSASSSARAEMGRSPSDSVGSSCSSHEGGSDREEQQQPDFHLLPASRSEGRESPTVKRIRMDSWVT